MRVGLCMSCAERKPEAPSTAPPCTRRIVMRNRAIHQAKRALFPRAQVPPVGPARVHCNAWLTAPPSQDTPPSALVLLNTPPRPASALRQLWSISSYRVCADAAANRLRDSIHLAGGSLEYALPAPLGHYIDTSGNGDGVFDQTTIQDQLASLLSFYWRSQGDQ